VLVFTFLVLTNVLAYLDPAVFFLSEISPEVIYDDSKRFGLLGKSVNDSELMYLFEPIIRTFLYQSFSIITCFARHFY
jgi:hypothetical protein